jgi:hypothetical protein
LLEPGIDQDSILKTDKTNHHDSNMIKLLYK